MFDCEQMAILDLVHGYIEDYYSIILPLLPIEKAEHIRLSQLIQESQNLVDIYEPRDEFLFKTPKHGQLFHKDFIVKTLEMINQELAFWEMYLTKTTFIVCDKFTLADCAFYPVIADLIHRGLNIDKFPAVEYCCQYD